MAGRVTALEVQRSVIEDATLRLDELLSREADLDYATAVTELTQESVALAGALQAAALCEVEPVITIQRCPMSTSASILEVVSGGCRF